MPYKLSLHVLVTFTEKVVPIQKHITVLYSEIPRYQQQNRHNESGGKNSGEVI